MSKHTLTDIKIAEVTGKMDAATDFVSATMFPNSEHRIRVRHHDPDNLTAEKLIENDSYLLDAGLRIQNHRLNRS